MAFILAGEHQGAPLSVTLRPDEEARVGRGTGNDLVIPSQTVSRNHARLVARGERVAITDLGSLNGTRINGRDVKGEALAVAGDTVEFGSVMLRLADDSAPSVPSPTFSDDADLSRSMVLSRDEITSSHHLLTESDRVLKLLTEVGQIVVLPEQPEQTFDRILELVERAIPADRILILVREEPGVDPVQKAARVRGDRALGRLMLSRTMVRMVVDEGSALLTGDVQSDERFMNQQSIMAQDLRSAMAVPLSFHEEILGVLYVDTNDPLTSYQAHDLRMLTVLGHMLGTKISNWRLLDRVREQERLEEEMRTARTIQRRLLPQTMPELPDFELAARQEMCDAVGGDLYDAGVLPDGRLQFLVGDVSGHGIPAALLMADALATLRGLRGSGRPPGEIVGDLDRHLLGSTEDRHYLTLFFAELDPATATVRLVSAGHPPACLVTSDRVEFVEANGFPVGLLDMPKEYSVTEIVLPPGSTLLVYTDGITEAARGEEQFGDRQFARILAECGGLTAGALTERVEHEVRSWLGDEGSDDDLTLVALRRIR
ncbi:MAG: SpoIIE family protein phosphatase [bacterium]